MHGFLHAVRCSVQYTTPAEKSLAFSRFWAQILGMYDTYNISKHMRERDTSAQMYNILHTLRRIIITYIIVQLASPTNMLRLSLYKDMPICKNVCPNKLLHTSYRGLGLVDLA
jgi:hypothetical protein